MRTPDSVMNAHREHRPRRRSRRAGGSQGIPIGAEQGRFTGIESPGAPAIPAGCGAAAHTLRAYLNGPSGRLRRDLRRAPVPPGELPLLV